MQKLFYQELFTFLRELASLQAHQNKIHSSEVYLLLKLMKKFEKKKNVKTLDMIVEKFYHLKKSKTTTSVEGDLLKFFLSKELKRVKTIPKVYRGLPRLFSRKKPEISKIDPLFTDLFSLKAKCLEKTLYTLYAGIKIKQTIEIVCLYEREEEKFFFQSLQECLNYKYLSVRCTLIPLLKKQGDNEGIVVKKDKKVSLRNTSKYLLDLVRSADVVLGYRVKNPGIEHFLEKDKESQEQYYQVIRDYGLLTNDYRTHDISLGLYFLEKGIFCFDKIEKQSSTFYLCAHTKEKESFFYIKLLIDLARNESADLRIVFLSDSPLKGAFKQSLAFLENKRIGKVVLEIDDEVTDEKSCDFSGKTLVLSYQSNRTFQEKKNLYAQSLEPVGISSDISFSYVASYQKAFFIGQFDQESTLLKDLLALAKNKLTGFPKAIVYLENLYQLQLHFLEDGQEEFVSEEYFRSLSLDSVDDILKRLKYLILNREVILGLKVLNKSIYEKFSANQFFLGLIKRSYLQKKLPKLKSLEEGILSEYLIGESTFLEMVKSISSLLTNRK